MQLTELIFNIAEPVGIFAFAASGASAAAKKGLDLFGIIFIGLTTALGGGVMRDVILGYTPPRMFESAASVCIAVAVSFIVFLLAKNKHLHNNETVDAMINLLDALGLAVFSVTGIQLAMDAGFADNAFLCVFLALTTAVGGGILRDVLICETPKVFAKHIYAVAAIIGGLLYYMLVRTNAPDVVSLLTAVFVTVIIRVLAAHFKWNLPHA